MKKRWVLGGVLVVLLGVSGTGLAVNHTWLEGRWAASRATAHLASGLEHVAGVRTATAVYDPIGLPSPTVAVRVTFAPTAPAGSWDRASSMIRSSAASHDLGGTTTTATFHQSGSTASAEVDPLLVSPAVVASEIRAWRGLTATFGDRISLRLGRASGDDGTGPITREYTVRTAADMRAIAAAWLDRAPEVDPSLPTTWSAPGLQLSAMPTAPVMAAVHALSAVMPLAPAQRPGASDTGTYAVVLGNVRGFQVEIVSLDHGKPAPGVPNEQLVDGTRAALASGAVQVDWSSAAGLPSIIAGDCGPAEVGGRTVTTTFSTNAVDRRFAATLTAAGLELPAGVRGGVCT